jgi:hypothetical protein
MRPAAVPVVSAPRLRGGASIAPKCQKDLSATTPIATSSDRYLIVVLRIEVGRPRDDLSSHPADDPKHEIFAARGARSGMGREPRRMAPDGKMACEASNVCHENSLFVAKVILR